MDGYANTNKQQEIFEQNVLNDNKFTKIMR